MRLAAHRLGMGDAALVGVEQHEHDVLGERCRHGQAGRTDAPADMEVDEPRLAAVFAHAGGVQVMFASSGKIGRGACR